MILTVPGKTFLLGEYVALDGGPSLLLSTAPRFELRIHTADSRRDLPFHHASPAGRYFAKYAADLGQWSYEFIDPWKGLGGLGASSAQFALLYTFHHDGDFKYPSDIDFKSLLEDYRACAWNGEGTPPSGADVVSQLMGEVTWYNGRTFEAETFPWPFPDLGFTLIRTGVKVATHEHLRQGTLAPHEVLRTIVSEAQKAFSNGDEMRLIEAVNACALALRQADLTASTTTDLLERMREKTNLFYAVKGCGAMGADIVLALHARESAVAVADWVASQGLSVCGAHAQLSSGLEIVRGRI